MLMSPWLWTSMKPGETTCPEPSITMAASPSMRFFDTAAILSPFVAISPLNPGVPVPSTINASFIRRSYSMVMVKIETEYAIHFTRIEIS